MPKDTGQNSDPISEFSDPPGHSTRSRTFLKRSVSILSINSKKSKNNDGSTSLSTISPIPARKRKVSTSSIGSISYDRRVSDSQVSDECASTCAYVADAGMGSSPGSEMCEESHQPAHTAAPEDSDSERSHTPTPVGSSPAWSLSNTELSTQQLVNEDENLQARNTHRDILSDLTAITKAAQCQEPDNTTTTKLLSDILEVFRFNVSEVGNASPGMSRYKVNISRAMIDICERYNQTLHQIAHDNDHLYDDPGVTSHPQADKEMDDWTRPRVMDDWGNAFEGPNPPSSSPDTQLILQAMKGFSDTVKALADRVELIENHNRSMPDTLSKPQTKHINHSTPDLPLSTPPVQPGNSTQPKKAMAQAIKEGKPPQAKPANPVKPTTPVSNGTEASAVRFIFRFLHGAPDEVKKRLSSLDVSRRLKGVFNDRMGLNKCRVLEAKWNLRGNLILIFPAHSNPSAIGQMEQEIRNALGLHAGCVFTRDTKWSKVIIPGVPTGILEWNDDQLITKEELMEEVRKHKTTEKLNITQNPDWTIRPENINSPFGSISFAFEDPDGSKLAQVLQEKFSLFGCVLCARAWSNKPILQSCDRCISYGHTRAHCHCKPRCAKCGYAHLTSQHNDKCKTCQDEAREKGVPCTHPLQCGVCRQNHEWDTDACPKRAKFRTPIAQIIRRTSDMDNQ
ncbi:hypothetical protein RSOLAG1IB_11584 [Rhizoctonia solani AG-1 IB]|uniref:Uncharacterized protein n=1 Tax=Thanatephorus cucumeris (strain AG1-IB / isolate 7/3/14) TaxID=1108050 RepID=A0A0B7F812_THACB|nr:hypothetical protein RSOLAG1IB_11584 [Rhizoctonia solani AG-1 IB]